MGDPELGVIYADPVKHGRSAYWKHRCRCDICTQAELAYRNRAVCVDCGKPCQPSKPKGDWQPPSEPRCRPCQAEYRSFRVKPLCLCGNEMYYGSECCVECRWRKPNLRGICRGCSVRPLPMNPRLLDLFCGAGGASMGYRQQGFDVVGVDINPQPDYPFPFIQADAIEYLLAHHQEYDAFHASPPCQAYTNLARGTNRNSGKYPDLIAATRAALSPLRRPYVIENVPSAPLLEPVMLCGEMFGLGVIRHRHFESNVWLEQPEHIPHQGRVAGWRHGEQVTGPYTGVYGKGGDKGSVAQWQAAMDIDWTHDRKAIAEAIPPAYTDYVAGRLLAVGQFHP